jgi:hypothetical protein
MAILLSLQAGTSSVFAADVEVPYQINCSLTITPEYNDFLRKIVIFGALNVPFTNPYDAPVRSVIISLIDENGTVVLTKEMYSPDQPPDFGFPGVEPRPIEARATRRLAHAGFSDVLWSMSITLDEIGQDEALEKVIAIMNDQAEELRRRYSRSACRVDAINVVATNK